MSGKSTIITVLHDCVSGKKHYLDEKDIFSVGRSQDADIPIMDVNCSRKQFFIEKTSDGFFLVPQSSSNTTYCNGKPINSKTHLKSGMTILVGPYQFIFHTGDSEHALNPSGSVLLDQLTQIKCPDLKSPMESFPGGTIFTPQGSLMTEEITLVKPIPIGDSLLLGRDSAKANLHLDHPSVSRLHAEVRKQGAEVFIHDLKSANGTFLNGKRIDRPVKLCVADRIDIGPFSILFEGSQLIPASREGKVDVTAWELSRVLPNGKVLLENISFCVKSREMVALIGPSGSGKTTLLSALSARVPADSGIVLLSNRDLYANFENMKQDLVVVPQRELLFEQLTVEKMLLYTARLRLPPDSSPIEINQLVDEILETVKMKGHKNTTISRLSGGQRKRVMLANELLSKPSLVFLDEVTSGLDEKSDKEMMELFRGIADSGKTVFCITHSLGQVESSCHLVCILTESGKLAFFGSPAEALEYFQVKKLGEVYEKLNLKLPGEWQQEFLQSNWYQKNIASRMPPSSAIQPLPVLEKPVDLKESFGEMARQAGILMQRQVECLFADTKALVTLMAQPIVVAFILIILFFNLKAYGQLEFAQKSKALFFLIQVSCFWFGCNNASKEVVRERSIFRRERDFNLGITSFYFSKLALFSMIGWIQAMLLLILVWIFCGPPGSFFQVATILMFITLTGTAFGLAISVFSNSESTAVNFIPMVLIPQILLAGFIIDPMKGMSLLLGKTFISCYWGFQAMIAVLPSEVFQNIYLDNSQAQANPLVMVFFILFHFLVFMGLSLAGLTVMERRNGASALAAALASALTTRLFLGNKIDFTRTK